MHIHGHVRNGGQIAVLAVGLLLRLLGGVSLTAANRWTRLMSLI